MGLKHDLVSGISSYQADGIDEGPQDTTRAKLAAQIASCLHKRTTNFLVSAESVLGHEQVQAFQQLLQFDKFWAAGFGVCAELAFSVLWPDVVEPLWTYADTCWNMSPYEMWHLARYGTC